MWTDRQPYRYNKANSRFSKLCERLKTSAVIRENMLSRLLVSYYSNSENNYRFVTCLRQSYSGVDQRQLCLKIIVHSRLLFLPGRVVLFELQRRGFYHDKLLSPYTTDLTKGIVLHISGVRWDIYRMEWNFLRIVNWEL
jgi:hypothetical protein